jgi:putative ABC transport system ATP-binding protein
MVVLEARRVTKVYPEGGDSVSALRGVDLTLREGEITTLEGPSGSGKTTLLFILGCMLTPSSGQLIIEGKEVDANRPERLREVRRSSIGFIFQHYNLIPALTAVENVEFSLNLKGLRGATARREAVHWIERVGLRDRQDARPRDLSGGQKQRVAIARALAGSSSIILADEPTASLDSYLGAQTLELFQTLAKRENRAVLIVTHDSRVRQIADRTVQIHDGQFIA